MNTPENSPKELSSAELDAVLQQARDEGWSSLALVSPEAAKSVEVLRELPPDRLFVVRDLSEQAVLGLAELTKLSSLRLVHLQIGAEKARALASLRGLTSLTLYNNEIGDEGARALASLSGLTSLDLGSNQIGAEGAQALASLSGLTSLHLNNNQIGAEGARALLEAWVDRPTAKNLTTLSISDNGDLSSLLPSEALNTSDAQAILAAYRRFRQGAEEETLQPLNEAKLLLVGNEGAGKTSLVRYLVDNLPRRDSEDPTRGTAIRENIDTKTWPADQTGGITLNVWDFGGQVIMRGTHQYFLTRRSLYLLVLDARFEDDLSIYDWLRIIRNRADDSPVIVVINKCDGDRRGPRLPEERIKKEHGVVAFIRTSCDKGDEAAAGIQDLRELITKTLAHHPRLEHIHQPFPRPYLRVKETVAALAKEENLLDRARFEQICEEGNENEAVTDPAEQRQLLGMLHDLGVVVAHGFDRDAPAVRREVNLLDPNWLTGAVYRILTSAQLVQQNGELAREQLSELLADPATYPEDRHEFILDMMQEKDISLCFKLPGSDPPRYLVPEGLHDEGPHYGTYWDDSLRFRYTYQLLPRNLMPRFIVESHREAVQQTTRWLTGVVLQASGCEILVEADLDQKQIDIRVKGPQKLRRSALNVALTHLEHVHTLNRDLGQEARVPLPDNPDVSVAYDHLLELESDPEAGPDYRFRPEGAKRFYTVTELLEGVRQETRPERPLKPRREVDGAVPEPRPNEPSWSKVTIAAVCAVVVLAVVVWLIPSLKLKAIVVGLAALAAVTAYLVRGLNPLLYYRRRITATIGVGIIVAPLDFALQFGRKHYPDQWWFQFDGRLSDWFYPAWALIVVGLIWADVRQRRGRRD